MEGEESISPSHRKSKKPRIEKDSQGFLTPSSPRTRKQRQQATNTEFASQNQFQLLPNPDSEMSMDEDEAIEIQCSKKQAARRSGPATNLQSKKISPKPIIVANSTFETVKNSINGLNLTNEAKIKMHRGGKDFTILASSIDDKKMIVKKLTDFHHQHFTFTEKQDRQILFVLLGHYEIPTSDLQKVLNIAKIPAIKVSKINRSLEDPIFLVSFEKNSITLDDLKYKHNNLNQLIVRWDKFKPRNQRPTQCRRCQRFGHAANNCALPYRCVKCTETHEPGKCSRTTREGLPSCVNCGTEGHTSNSISCPVYKKHIENIEARKKPSKRIPREFPASRFDWNQKNSQPEINYDSTNFPSIASQSSPSTSHPPIVNQNREYRPALSQTFARSPPKTTNLFSQLRESKADFIAIPGIKETIENFVSFVAEIKAAKSEGERLTIILTHTGFMAEITSLSP